MTDIEHKSGTQHASMHAVATSPNPTSGLSSSDDSRNLDFKPTIDAQVPQFTASDRSGNQSSQSSLALAEAIDSNPPLSSTISSLGNIYPNVIDLSSQEGDFTLLGSQDSWKQSQIDERSLNDGQAGARSSSSPSARGSRESSSGIKRTANGQVKISSALDSSAPTVNGNTTRHAPPSAGSSNGLPDNVKEISQQLRTRLAYAMVKVQHGWQTQSLDEIESLASQSPKSALSNFPPTSDNRTTAISPRVALSANFHRKWSDSDSSDSLNWIKPHHSIATPSPLRVKPYETAEARHHRGTSSRVLAPPAHITPGQPKARRNLNPNGTHHLVTSPNEKHRPQPSRLQISRPAPARRTTSQNAAMEADAVETLLFMASPNNSGYFPSQSTQSHDFGSSQHHQSLQTSPLREQFSQTSVTSPKKRVVNGQIRPGYTDDKSATIDSLLDRFSDDSEDDLEEAFRYVDRHRAMKVST